MTKHSKEEVNSKDITQKLTSHSVRLKEEQKR